MNTMIDIETLGREPGCAIVSIGAAKFDTSGVADTFYCVVSEENCKELGLSEDPETVAWWEDRNEDAKEALGWGVPLARALDGLDDFCEGEVWANSPRFDCAILRAAYDALGREPPWRYYDEQDYRTLKNLPIDSDKRDTGSKHRAVDDAVNQALTASSILDQIEATFDT